MLLPENKMIEYANKESHLYLIRVGGFETTEIIFFERNYEFERNETEKWQDAT